MDNQKKITVTSPLLPPLEEFIPYLEDIWQRKWLTNNGPYHQELEKALCRYLHVPYISLFTNGTLPIMVAIQELRITGEVITTPFKFCGNNTFVVVERHKTCIRGHRSQNGGISIPKK